MLLLSVIFYGNKEAFCFNKKPASIFVEAGFCMIKEVFIRPVTMATTLNGILPDRQLANE